MSKDFFSPEQDGDRDKRLFAPATARNREPIAEVLSDILPETGMVLELASGSGEHAVHMTAALPHLYWQPSDVDPAHLASIAAWARHAQNPRLLPPMRLDVRADDWMLTGLPAPVVAITAINLIHIASWDVAEGLIAGASRYLETGGILYLYGPFMRHGAHTAPSNEAFDASLKARDPAWGVRAMEDMAALAETAGFAPPDIRSMPANNFSLIFRKLD